MNKKKQDEVKERRKWRNWHSCDLIDNKNLINVYKLYNN